MNKRIQYVTQVTSGASNFNNTQTCFSELILQPETKARSDVIATDLGRPLLTYAERRHCYTITSLQPLFFVPAIYTLGDSVPF